MINLALYDDRPLVIRITKYEFIFVMWLNLGLVVVLKILFVI